MDLVVILSVSEIIEDDQNSIDCAIEWKIYIYINLI